MTLQSDMLEIQKIGSSWITIKLQFDAGHLLLGLYPTFVHSLISAAIVMVPYAFYEVKDRLN